MIIFQFFTRELTQTLKVIIPTTKHKVSCSLVVKALYLKPKDLGSIPLLAILLQGFSTNQIVCLVLIY